MRLLRDSGWISASLAVSRALSFAMVVVLARLLPVNEFALYIVCISATVLLVPLADAGMWPLVARMAARRRSERVFAFTAAADRARARPWVAAAVVAGAGWSLGLWPHGDLWLLALLGAMGEAEIDTMRGEFFGRLRYAMGSLLLIVPAALGLLGAFALPLLGLTATSGLLVFAASRVIPALVLHARVPLRTKAVSLSLREGIPFAATRTLTTAYVTSDVLLLSLFSFAGIWIAVYGVMYRILTAIQLIPASIAAALYPRVVEPGRHRGTGSTRAAAGLSLATAAIVVALLLLDLPMIVSVFGAGYQARVDVVRPLLLVLLPIALSMVCTSGVQGRDHEKDVLRVVVVVAIVNIIGNLVLIPAIGVRGALVATSAAEWGAAFGTLLLAVKFCDVRRRDLRAMVGAAVITILAFVPAVPDLGLSAAIATWIACSWWVDDFDLRASVASLRASASRIRRGNRRRPARREIEPIGAANEGG
jgi:O-antigen/teichoic acid export membrane protein